MRLKWKESYLTNLEFGRAASEKPEGSHLNESDGMGNTNAAAMFADKHFQ